MLTKIAFAIAGICGLAEAAIAQNANQDQIDPRSLRRFWSHQQTTLRAAPYKLTSLDQAKFEGSFGVDLSHYSFDIKTSGQCSTKAGYETAKCSCTANWQAFRDSNIRYIYSKASDGIGFDYSFPRFWKEMKSFHDAKQMFRGAFHFLRPGLSAEAQAATFLGAIGATAGERPKELPPVLDIEWSSKRVYPKTSEFNACPISRRVENDKGQYFCDMWYKMTAQQIADLAGKWIGIVSRATGSPVIVYTNTSAWWNPVLGGQGKPIAQSQAFWPSRYTSNGPTYDAKWSKQGGSSEWRMPPLPIGSEYPKKNYTTPNLWQFSDNGYLSQSAFFCAGSPTSRGMDMDWLPVQGSELTTVFGIDDH